MYQPISLKDAVNKINESWFLPAVQRPYVWGNRYEAEKYICRLFDSLYNRYPIGVLILWETNEKVAFREFMDNFNDKTKQKKVEESFNWNRPKALVYDGQQRLQTLYSCLKYTFNNRSIVFDLSYDEEKDIDSDTGFRFISNTSELKKYEVPLKYLFALPEDSKTRADIRKEYTAKIDRDNENYEELALLIESNLSNLWDVFVVGIPNSLAYYSIKSSINEDKVNDIFERLNTGGISLSNADLLFSKIVAVKGFENFQTEIIEFTEKISKEYKISFDYYDILQLLNLIVRGRTRIDADIKEGMAKEFHDTWNGFQKPFETFIRKFLIDQFWITDLRIIRNKIPLYAVILYFYKLYTSGLKFNNLSPSTIQKINKFFITAEINDWSLQSYSDNFAKIILDNPEPLVFPYENIKKFVREKGNRKIDIDENTFISYPKMALKFLNPKRQIISSASPGERFKPEIDHIFPRNLENKDDKYSDYVDVIWNMQPVSGDVNNWKRNIHPQKFFKDEYVRNGVNILGSKYIGEYEFLPENLDSPEWNDHESFIKFRRKKMIKFLEQQYDIKIKEDEESPYK